MKLLIPTPNRYWSAAQKELLKKPTVEHRIFRKLESLRLRKLDCIYEQIIARKAPGEVRLRDQCTSELAKSHLVIDEKGSCLVDDGTLVVALCYERLERHVPEGDSGLVATRAI